MQMEVGKLIILVYYKITIYIFDIEWIVATINKEKLLTTEQLKAAFSLFDSDGSGSISADEVKELLYSG